MRVLVCGSRGWQSEEGIYHELNKLPPNSEVLHGGARGADAIAGVIADHLGMDVTTYKPDWSKHGKAAGIIRNDIMLDTRPDLVLAFWDGKSTGTKHTIKGAISRGLPVRIISEGGHD